VALVSITLMFDEIHHKSEEIAAHNVQSSLRESPKPKEETHTLWASLHVRASGELSVLGFLALLVWCCNQAELFDKVALRMYDYDAIKMPPTGADYLHTVEAVHMHLFLAMCFYFIFLGLIIYVATHLIRFAVRTNAEICKAYGKKEIGPDPAQWLESKTKAFRLFFRFRQWYFHSLQSYRASWPFLDEHIVLFEKDLQIETGSMELPKMLREWYPFDVYVVVNFRYALHEMIEIKWQTWLTIMMILVIKVIHVRESKIKDDKQMDIAILVLIMQSVVLTVAVWVAIATRKMSNGALDDTFERRPRNTTSSYKCFHKLHPFRMLTRFLQVALFFTFYEFASVIATKATWETDHPGSPNGDPSFPKSAKFTLVLVLCIIPEGLLVGTVLPMFSTLVSTGSLMQDDHVRRMTAIVKAHLDGDMTKLRKIGDNVEAFKEHVHGSEASSPGPAEVEPAPADVEAVVNVNL